jgi:hypothetical protein
VGLNRKSGWELLPTYLAVNDSKSIPSASQIKPTAFRPVKAAGGIPPPALTQWPDKNTLESLEKFWGI